jgi:sarcosine oxidase
MVFEGSRNSCELHGLLHEVLNSRELSARFPAYRLPSETMAIFQPDGGFLLPEACISAHVMLAQLHGAEVHAREAVLDWEPRGDGVLVRTDKRQYEAERLIVSAGPWISHFVPALRGKAIPERQVLAWLQPLHPEWFTPDRFPVFNLAVHDGRYYGFPVFGIPGFKFGRYHHLGEQFDPDNPSRECNVADERVLRKFAEQYFPEGAGPTLSLHMCLFTNTPDEHFVLDVLPDVPQVVVASPCSGHGFKFASVVGEILADLATNGHTQHEISLLRLSRFGSLVQ